MAHDKAKRPRPAKRRTLPSDGPSLEEAFRAIHRQMESRAAHLKRDPHDAKARRGFEMLHGDRARAYERLAELDPRRAQALYGGLGLIFSSEVS